MQIQRMDWIDKYKKSIDEIAAQGFDTVSLVVDTRQETAESLSKMEKALRPGGATKP